MGVAEIVGTIVVIIFYSWFLIEIGKSIQEKEYETILKELREELFDRKTLIDRIDFHKKRVGSMVTFDHLNSSLSMNEKKDWVISQLVVELKKEISPYVKFETIKELNQHPYLKDEKKFYDILKGTLEFYIKPLDKE